MLEIRIGRFHFLWADSALRVLNLFRQSGVDEKEAGGILLGEVAGDTVLVSRVSPPSEKDRRFRYAFIRNRSTAQHIIDHEHINSGGRTTYLGEWHTHPATIAVPSRQDKQMIRKQMKKNVVPAGFLLLTIIGTEMDYVGVFCDDQLSGLNIALTCR